MSHKYSELLVHVIFSTKNRERVLQSEIRPPLFAYINGVLKERDCRVLIINGVEDHVHLLFTWPPRLALSDIIRDLKASSSGWLADRRPPIQFDSWQKGYAAFTVSHSNARVVENYIDRQEEHHRRVSFQDELRTFLVRHEIAWNEEHLWS